MKKVPFLTSIFTAVLVLPLVLGSGPAFGKPIVTDAGSATRAATSASVAAVASATVAPRASQVASTRVGKTSATIIGPQGQACATAATGVVGQAPGTASARGVAGTTSNDLASFAYKYNAIRIANCLPPIPYGNFRYNACMEARLFWMAESPSPSPLDAWGHIGSVRIDGVPSTGCDGNLAGGSGYTGATAAQKWWTSTSHRASLYRPTASIAGVCVAFALVHGGIDEPYSFVRSAARWTTC